MKKVCKICNREYTTDHKRQKFCSYVCCAIWRKGKRPSAKSEFKKGHKPWHAGKPLPRYYKKSLSEARKMSKYRTGKLHPRWRGGISKEPYSQKWTRMLKASIRERDNYTCRMCSRKQKKRAFDVHHIDYDKKNCNPENLITLCNICHIKTYTNRKYWIREFRKIMKIMKIYKEGQ